MALSPRDWRSFDQTLRVLSRNYSQLVTGMLVEFDSSIPDYYRSMSESSSTAQDFFAHFSKWEGATELASFPTYFRKASRRFDSEESFFDSAFTAIALELNNPPEVLLDEFKYESYLDEQEAMHGHMIHELIALATYGLHVAWNPSSRILIPEVHPAVLKGIVETDEIITVIPPRFFEELVAAYYELLGYDVQLTKVSRDFGADVLAWNSRAEDSGLIAVQAKRYTAGRKVGLKGIYELHGAVTHYNAVGGHLVTTTDFTGPAKSFAARVSYELVGLEQLRDGIFQVLEKYGRLTDER